MAENTIKVQKASNSTIYTYGVGAIGVGIKNNLLGTWTLIYYNQVLGLDAYLVTIALAIALVFDAISDPFVGIWSDRIRTRWGRRHPFMYVAIIPFALSYYFLLADPGDIEDSDLFYRLLFLMLILRLSMTFYEVPRGALAAELTKDYDQRNKIQGVSMALSWIGGAGIGAIHQYFFLGDSFLNAEGYQTLAFWGGLGIFLSTVYSAIGTHYHIPDLYQPPQRSLKFREFFGEIKQTLSNKSWVVLFLAGCIYAIVTGADTGVGVYYNQYLWKWEPQAIAIYSVCAALTVVAVAFFSPLIAQGKEKKHVAIVVFLCAVFLGPLPIFLRLIDPYVAISTFPENGSDMLWWVMLIHACTTSGLAMLGFIYVGSMGMEIVEDVETKTGRREEGLLGTVNSMIHKLVGAGGVVIAGVIITVSGFDDPALDPSEKYTTAINTFSWIHVAVGFFLPLCSTLLITQYSINRKGHMENVSELGYTNTSSSSGYSGRSDSGDSLGGI